MRIITNLYICLGVEYALKGYIPIKKEVSNESLILCAIFPSAQYSKASTALSYIPSPHLLNALFCKLCEVVLLRLFYLSNLFDCLECYWLILFINIWRLTLMLEDTWTLPWLRMSFLFIVPTEQSDQCLAVCLLVFFSWFLQLPWCHLYTYIYIYIFFLIPF